MILATIFSVCMIGQPCNDYIVDVAQTTEDCVYNTQAKQEEFYLAGDDKDQEQSLMQLFNDWKLKGIDPKQIQDVEFYCGAVPDKDIP